MDIITPDYFKDFKCKASKCNHSCCNAGWHIDVDAKSLAKYTNSKDKFLQNLNNYIQNVDGKRAFKNSNNGCVFFRDGLCSLVCKYGQNYLCDVCRDYPRFYNNLNGITQAGLSLDCEQATQIVLCHKDKISFGTSNTNSKSTKINNILKLQTQIIKLLQDRSLNIENRISNVFKHFGRDNFLFKADLFEVLDKMEWLNFDGVSVKNFLQQLVDYKFCMQDYQIENLLVNFVYRYFANNTFKGTEYAKFCFGLFVTLCCDKLIMYFGRENNLENQVLSISTFCRQIESSVSNVQMLINYFDN